MRPELLGWRVSRVAVGLYETTLWWWPKTTAIHSFQVLTRLRWFTALLFLFFWVLTLVGCRIQRCERRKGQKKAGGWRLQDVSFSLINIQMESCSWEEVSAVIEEKEREDGGGEGGWNPHAISSDLSIALFRATVSFNCSIKVFGYQILPLIDFPKPSASGWESLKVMRLSTQKPNKGLDKDWSRFFFFTFIYFKRHKTCICKNTFFVFWWFSMQGVSHTWWIN